MNTEEYFGLLEKYKSSNIANDNQQVKTMLILFQI